MEDPSTHWENVYATRPSDRVSWYRPHLELSLSFIERAKPSAESVIVDVGGGASTLVDDLVDRGHTRVTVLDLSAAALDVAARRLGPKASAVDWRVGNVLTVELPEASVDVWHDRAVFHFLTDPADRARYVEVVRRATKPGAHVLVATFGPNGPERCSGLEVARYTSDAIHGVFGAGFVKVSEATETHETPCGNAQEFVYCFCRRPTE